MIVIDRVSKYYGRTPAVQDLDVTIDAGECIGFLGLNGAGKSTTLRMLSCLLLPTSGSIKIGGFDAEKDPHEIRKLIGYLPDTPPLYPEMRVDEFLRFAGRLRRMSKAEVEKRLPTVIEKAGLSDVAEQVIETLSHGYRQRVGIAQAIIHDPKLLILDEPIQGLDPVQIVEMRELIRQLRGEHTILLSSHILSEIQQTCDRLLFLRDGKVVALGTEDEIVSQLSERSATYRDAVARLTILVEVRGAEAAVREALNFGGVTIADLVSTPDGVCRAKIECFEDPRETLAKRVVEAGLGLLAMQRTGQGLENLFLELSTEAEA